MRAIGIVCKKGIGAAAWLLLHMLKIMIEGVKVLLLLCGLALKLFAGFVRAGTP